MHQLEKRDRGEDVVTSRDDGRGGESPLEPDRQVDECNEERQQDRYDRPALELAPNAGTNGFRANHLQVVLAELLLQDPPDGNRDGLSALRLCGDRGRVLCPDRELAVRSELLDLGPTDSRLVKRGPDLADIGRLRELQLHQRSAGELDTQVERLDRERSKPQHDEGDRDRRHHLPPANEIVARVVKNSKHQMLRLVWASRERFSQIM